MAKQTYDFQLAFYQQLLYFYKANRGKIRNRYKDLSLKYLDYNDKNVNPNAYLRRPQFEALEIYVLLKEFFGNRSVRELFLSWLNNEDEFSSDSYYTDSKGQISLFSPIAKEQSAIIAKQFEQFRFEYPNYIYALTMGLGKTYLIAASIFYEFILARKYPKDERYCHNALVFAPDKTVLQSLKEIITLDKHNIVPPDYVNILEANIQVHFLDDNAESTLNTLDNSNYNIIISNTHKIIVKKKQTADSPAEKLFAFQPVKDSVLSSIYGDEDISSPDDLIINQRFQKLLRLQQIGVYVDEAHHLYGKDLNKELYDTENQSSLRRTINMLAEKQKNSGSPVVACYNYTGTPYVNNTVLPEVVYSYGLAESIAQGYLKDADVEGFHVVKDKDYLNSVINRFFDTHGKKKYEDLFPKLAIYAANIDEIKKHVLPWTQQILTTRGISTDKILVNVGDDSLTKDIDIRHFNDLDIAGSEGAKKQIILLCEKGQEGWNCRSLFGVALFRSPKSKIFVLQSTMRCLRQITDVQQKANVYLSEENYKTLDDELKKNFNVEIDDVFNKNKKGKKEYHVKVLPPPRWLTIKEIQNHYEKKDKNPSRPISFDLDSFDYTKYEAYAEIKKGIAKDRKAEKVSLDQYVEKLQYSPLFLVAEISRYMNIPCLKIQDILEASKNGIDKIIEAVNKYNTLIYDKIIPDIFNYLYEIIINKDTKERKLILLRDPPSGKGYYEFHADPALVVTQNQKEYNIVKGKSFHADTYCFDSMPELSCFNQYVFSDKVKEIYFTGMFTSSQGDLAIQYIDPETHGLRNYYPDFVAKMKDNTYQIIEVKGDNMLYDPVVQAKKNAAKELAAESTDIEYIMYAGSFITKHKDILNPQTSPEFIYEPTENGYGAGVAADSGDIRK